MTASLRTVCADILRNLRPTETYQYYRRCQGANLLDYVDAREAVELADECADERDGLLVKIADLEETNGELNSDNNKLKLKNKKLTTQVDDLRRWISEEIDKIDADPANLATALTALRGIASGELS